MNEVECGHRVGIEHAKCSYTPNMSKTELKVRPLIALFGLRLPQRLFLVRFVDYESPFVETNAVDIMP